jgi:hypothetical protein
MVALDLLQLVAQILIVENDTLAISNDSKRPSPIDIYLNGLYSTARISSSKVFSIYLSVFVVKM